MKITAKLAFNAIVLVLINAAIVAAGLTGIHQIRQRVGDLTERSTPYQTRTLELQRSLQSFMTALTGASASKTLPELETAKANAARALAGAHAAEESLVALSANRVSYATSAELSRRTEEIFPALEAGIKAEEASVEAGKQASVRVAESSRELKDLDSKIRALQLNRMALFMSKLDQSNNLEDVRSSPALVQSSIATNCLLGNSELVRLGALIEARAQQLLAARNASEAAHAVQGVREVFIKIDPSIAYLQKMLKKLNAQDELRMLASVKTTLYAVRQLLLSDSGAYSKIEGSLQMAAKAERINRRIREVVAQDAEQSRTRVSMAYGDQEKTVRSVNDLVRQTNRGVLILGIGATLLGLAFSIAIAIGVARPIGEFSALSQRFGLGDLTVRMNQDRKDEFGEMARHFNQAAGKLNSMLSELATDSEKLARSATELSGAVGGIHQEAATISAQIEKTASEAGQTNNRIKDTHSMVTSANESMVELSSAIELMAENSEAAQAIVKTIDEIAFKTNLLSLNAAIEAARAGAAGAGFEVVAREVRALAVQTAQAAQETTERIGQIIARTRQGKQAAETTGGAFEKVAALTAEVDSFIDGIAASSREQAARIKRINGRTTRMGRIADENAAAAERLSTSMGSFQVDAS